jgi:hypothetical protein
MRWKPRASTIGDLENRRATRRPLSRSWEARRIVLPFDDPTRRGKHSPISPRSPIEEAKPAATVTSRYSASRSDCRSCSPARRFSRYWLSRTGKPGCCAQCRTVPEAVRCQHDRDLACGSGRVPLPAALARKHVAPRAFRHSFAAHPVQDKCDIRTVQRTARPQGRKRDHDPHARAEPRRPRGSEPPGPDAAASVGRCGSAEPDPRGSLVLRQDLRYASLPHVAPRQADPDGRPIRPPAGHYPGRPIPLNGTPSIPIQLLDRQGIKATMQE